ncbi:MAG: glycogen/starch/alpha-glucan phosphorylase [Xanthobacteraceae bacterium]|uniref:glycogen/starch/alpha-glucan phosphorylase n=1 Tax=Pseudolabrys sp. TaxID=1960880 RepID=UPI003D0FA3D5
MKTAARSLAFPTDQTSRHDEPESLRHAIRTRLVYSLGRTLAEARMEDWYVATALAVRDRIVARWLDVRNANRANKKKRVYYLSIEFLIGRLLFDTLVNLGLLDEARDALHSFGIDIDDVKAVEPDAALGNGGLGRLAACYLDSMAAVGVPGYGYGIRYEHGLFEQHIRDGWQEERPETWLRNGNPWELPRPEKEYPIGFGGAVEYVGGDGATARAIWYPAEYVIATTHDLPIAGWRGRHVNILRLWGARAADPIQLAAFNEGDHVGAMRARNRAEAITRVLYPNDQTVHGQELRLRQEYFFTAASLRDILRRHIEQFGDVRTLSSHAAIQLNDTHPAVAVAELMRLLIDDYDIGWDEAWRVTRETLSFTNHTLLPEALESWPTELFGRLLPRHLQIIYLINWLHLKEATEAGHTDPDFIARISLVSEGEQKRVRMAHLAFVGSHAVNGVSELHTDLLGRTVFGDLLKVSATRLVNKTNGISFRRWLFKANVGLTDLIRSAIGPAFLDDPERLGDLDRLGKDAGFVEAFRRARYDRKQALADLLPDDLARHLDPEALFDVQVKRIHEYKRQFLNILETIACYQEICANPNADVAPRVKLIAGKAAPGYERAKLIIKLAHNVARVINADPRARGRLKLLFVPNYSVSLAEALIPAADLSEQISTAGMEASGTGNMKLALNGALTIGTLDGANIEIREKAGAEHFFLFGMTAAEVQACSEARVTGAAAAERSPRLRQVVNALSRGEFSDAGDAQFQPLIDALLDFDPFMVAADFDAYWNAQREVDRAWLDPARWWRSSIRNTARMGFFSSDRAVRAYARDIWRVPVD